MSTLHLVRGIDVGGTSIKGILADTTGTVYGEWSVSTPKGGDNVVEAITGLVHTMDSAALAGELSYPADSHTSDSSAPQIEILNKICVDMPGIVDTKNGVGVIAVNLVWENYPFVRNLSNALGMPAFIMHDARAGAYGEARFGSAPETCLYVPIGTGIGAAILAQGDVFSLDPWAGEVGQIPMADPDNHGSHVALEKICSAQSFAHRFHALRPGLLPASAGAYEVFRLRDADADGSAEADYVVRTGLATLADAITSWTSLIGPIPVVIGGGLGKEGQPLVDELTDLVNERSFKSPQILTASRGSLSQALGTVAMCLDKDF